MTPALELAPQPQSVRQARTWIVRGLTRIGRDDLVDAAELGVSELVTNAILHSHPPIAVRLGGTPLHPRVEVHDNSIAPPALRDMTDEARLMATVGRGLGIVAMYSTTWGAEVSAQGKVVWFEPCPESDVPEDDAAPPPAVVFDFGEHVDELLADAEEPEEMIRICLLGMPVKVFAHYRIWYEDLRRELRLLALNHGQDYPVATELSELTLRVEQERRQARGTSDLDVVLDKGDDRADLEYVVPVSAPATMTRLRQLLEEVDVFCREQWLLTLAASRQQLQLREWYLGEFERQGRGEEPRPWPGSYDIEEDPTE